MIDRALIQQAEVSKIRDARKYDHDLLYRWMNKPKPGTHVATGIELLPFRKESFDDLVVLRPRPEYDGFTRLVVEHLWPWLSRKVFYRWKVCSPLNRLVRDN